ncbi:MAG TPA: M2 family metallopeptidase [Steroidobacteraceae bacterium]|jgi:peptidyl-dipeptidase A|nr:M2 family metallopeptidase [Steroidobacteraceae bacterium]
MRAGFLLCIGVAAALAGCVKKSAPPPAPTASAFVARVNEELADLGHEAQLTGFTQDTFLTSDTQFLNAQANDHYLAALGRAAQGARQFAAEKLAPADARALALLKFNVAAPAPRAAAERTELTALSTRLTAMYGEAKYCAAGAQPDAAACQNINQLSAVLAKSRNYDELVAAWKGWHDIGAPMRAPYRRFVELANAGARELGFEDLGVMWRARYDMSPAQFDAEAERLWQQVKPLYAALQCHARAKLAEKYGARRVPAGAPIPAQLLGNMWAQAWNNLYDDILKPYPAVKVESADRQLAAQGWDAVRMTRSAESFYTSLGFPALPQTFWERSLLVRPRDREVVCQPSAWDMNDRHDVRLKVCLTPTEEDLYIVYHELGHVYYFISYAQQPYLFRDGANDGFHEAIGDTIKLSVTPAYLTKIGLAPAVAMSREALINQQMKIALEKLAFLPFGRLIDLWRWRVFSGEITSANYNASWWQLRRHYQGIAPPVARTEADFDPGAKYHIPTNTPYTRYFLAVILQFQFHKALCAIAGQSGPLNECSIFGSTAAGARLAQMLALGASEPWQDAMQKLTGTRRIDAAAITEYFQPLMGWLTEQNKNRQCGWE